MVTCQSQRLLGVTVSASSIFYIYFILFFKQVWGNKKEWRNKNQCPPKYLCKLIKNTTFSSTVFFLQVFKIEKPFFLMQPLEQNKMKQKSLHVSCQIGCVNPRNDYFPPPAPPNDTKFRWSMTEMKEADGFIWMEGVGALCGIWYSDGQWGLVLLGVGSALSLASTPWPALDRRPLERDFSSVYLDQEDGTERLSPMEKGSSRCWVKELNSMCCRLRNTYLLAKYRAPMWQTVLRAVLGKGTGVSAVRS